MKSLFITGTGTGIGKTFFTGLTARLAVSLGLRTAVMKPVQTGILRIEDGDIGTVRKLAPGILELPDELACPYLLKMECSPHLAAEAEGVEIKVERILEAARRIEREFKPDVLLFEGAGGVCVPLKRGFMTTKLMGVLKAPAILVALAGLGTVNHVVLSARELEREHVPLAGVAVNMTPAKPGPIELDNLRCIAEEVPTEILAVTQENPDLSGRGFSECAGLLRLLEER